MYIYLIIPNDNVYEGTNAGLYQLMLGKGSEFIIPHHRSLFQFISYKFGNLKYGKNLNRNTLSHKESAIQLITVET